MLLKQCHLLSYISLFFISFCSLGIIVWGWYVYQSSQLWQDLHVIFPYLAMTFIAIHAHIYVLKSLNRDQSKLIYLYFTLLVSLCGFTLLLFVLPQSPIINTKLISRIYYMNVLLIQFLLMMIVLSPFYYRVLHLRSTLFVAFLTSASVLKMQVIDLNTHSLVFLSPYILKPINHEYFSFLVFGNFIIIFITLVLTFYIRKDKPQTLIRSLATLFIVLGAQIYIFTTFSVISYFALAIFFIGSLLFLRSFLYRNLE